MLVVQYEPNGRVSMTADALYVDFSDQKILRGVEIPFGWGQMGQTITIDDVSSNGIVSQATSVGHKVLVRNDYEERNAELSQFGFNVEVNASDNTNVVFDVSRSEVERDIYSMESYAGTGRGASRGAGDTITYNLGGEAGQLLLGSFFRFVIPATHRIMLWSKAHEHASDHISSKCNH